MKNGNCVLCSDVMAGCRECSAETVCTVPDNSHVIMGDGSVSSCSSVITNC